MIGRRPGYLSDADRAAFKVLGLEEDPDTYAVTDVDTRWRQLRAQLHPDKPTGDAQQFALSYKAYQAARFYALEPKRCPDCQGTGKREAPSQRSGVFGANPLMFNCDTCRGSGLR